MTKSLLYSIIGVLCVSALGQQPQKQSEVHPAISIKTFEARLSLGFNYDLLRRPTDVSFDYSKGFIGFNIPFEQTVNPLQLAEAYGSSLDILFGDTTLFTDGEEFRPKTGAKQHTNTTIRVDVPMLGGVCTFAHIQNFYLKYSNTLGNANFLVDPDYLGEGIDLILRGTVNMPIDLTMGWETTSFGYVYQVNKNLLLAFELSRHIFRFNLLGQVNVDILGRLHINQEYINEDRLIDYNSKKLKGFAAGHYEADSWSPSLGIQLWRFNLASRFGLETKAYGTFEAKYAVPFFINPATGQPDVDFSSKEELMKPEVRDGLLNLKTDSVYYYTNINADWKLPQGHTIAFDIIRDHLSISYTRIFGEIAMYHKNPDKSDTLDTKNTKANYADVDFGVKVNNIMILSGSISGAHFNVGVFTLDFRVNKDERLLGKIWENSNKLKNATLEGYPLFPVLTCGTAIGSTTQLALELDILPLPAVKTGFVYYF